MNNVKLVLPDVKYRDSFLSAIPEFRALENKIWQDQNMADMNDNMSESEFSDYLKSILDRANSKTNKKLTYWLIDEDGWAGTIRIRPNLSKEQAEDFGHIGYEVRPSKRGQGYAKQMIRFALAECAQIGISKACFACDNDNEPSKKTIISTFREYGGDDGWIDGCNINDYHCWIKTSK
ncbi:MAG: GNAT family N-acetyltransferase [Alphaproteobacteria bacterium]|nr:GNAT family N-acetyltransferase [Alphaproteobacteria bacterium]